MWMRFCPGERLLFGIEKAINDDGAALSVISPAQARGFAIDQIRSAIYGHTCHVTKVNFAARGHFLRIDSAMFFAQRYAVPSCILAWPASTLGNRAADAH